MKIQDKLAYWTISFTFIWVITVLLKLHQLRQILDLCIGICEMQIYTKDIAYCRLPTVAYIKLTNPSQTVTIEETTVSL